MSIARVLLLAPLFALTVGCASITGTPIQSISVQSVDQGGKEVTGCACELTNKKGKWFVTTPGSTTITRSNDDLSVMCQKEGLDPGRVSVVSWTKGSMFGNILFGGGVGAIIDHNTGSAYEYPAIIQVLLGSNKIIDVTKPEGEQVVIKPMDGKQPEAVPAVMKVDGKLDCRTMAC